MSTVEAHPDEFNEFEQWKARRIVRANRERHQRQIDLEPGEVVPDITLKQVNWTLDDAAAAALKPGKVFKLSLVLRIDSAWEFSDGRRWKTSLLEIEGMHD